MRRATLLAGLAAPALAGPAAAEQAAWTVDLGALARARPDHIGATTYRVDAVPIIEADYGGRISLSLDDGAKWRALRRGPVSLGPIAEYRQSFNDNLPRGAFRMNDVVELGGFTEFRTPIGIAEARLRHSIGGYDGWSGDLSFNTGAPVAPKLLLAGQARLSWADSNFTQEYFGLRPHVAGSFGMPRFLDEDYLATGAEIDAIGEITPRIRLVIEATADRVVSELPPSPIVSTRNIFTAGIGLTYHWSSSVPGGPHESH